MLVGPTKLEACRVSMREVEVTIQANNLHANGGFVEEVQGEQQ